MCGAAIHVYEKYEARIMKTKKKNDQNVILSKASGYMMGCKSPPHAPLQVPLCGLPCIMSANILLYLPPPPLRGVL